MGLWRQFWLMMWKNWVLMKRNKIWIASEILVSFFVTFPMVFIVIYDMKIMTVKSMEYDSFSLRGTSEDLNLSYPDTKPIRDRWCDPTEVFLGYTAHSSSLIPEVEILMNNMTRRFRRRKGADIQKEFMKDEKTLLKTLKADETKKDKCEIQKYMGGVIFDKLDIQKKILEYRILIGMKGFGRWDWMLKEKWFDSWASKKEPPMPETPPYFYSGFLTLQYAIETTFVQLVTNTNMKNVSLTLQSFPKPEQKINTATQFLGSMPKLWAIAVCISVLHLSKDIGAEKENIKPFLSAMGLSTQMFYASHVFFGTIKCAIIYVICSVPIAVIIQPVDPSIFLAIVVLHSLSAMTFGALISSFFQTPKAILKGLFVFWAASAGVSIQWTPDLDEILQSFLHSFNANSAFTLGIQALKEHVKDGKSLGWTDIFDGAQFKFPVGAAILMQIFDIVWMAALTLIVDRLRTQIEPRGFFRSNKIQEQSDNEKGTEGSEKGSKGLLDGSAEVDEARDSAEPGIEVDNLVKIWASTGERAIAGLSLRAVKGQVTVLLGHNGAGKSTTFASIAGIIRPTSGSISICGHDVASELGECRKKIGLCPQYNPLYDKLTVEEHLWLIYGLKGAPKSLFYEEEHELLEQLQLTFKTHDLSMNLSGGMKRKLCVCMALIGQSEVVLLDEPTAGMDPGARKDVQAILEKEKSQRTILLTTHYMDEAEVLGDWVMIMSAGKMVASATSKYLKQRYGTGYVLTIVINHKTDEKDLKTSLEQICQAFVPNAKIGEQHGQQIEVTLPEKEKSHFVDLFRALEALQQQNFESQHLSRAPPDALMEIKKQKIEITTFGLSLNTLEQVFLQIVKLAEKKKSREKSEKSIKSNNSDSEDMMESQCAEPEKQGFSRVVAQYLSIFKKKFLYMIRNAGQLIFQIVLPICLLFGYAYISSGQIINGDQTLNLALDSFGPSRVVIHGENSSNSLAKNFEKIVQKGVDGKQFLINRYPESKSLLNISNDLSTEYPKPGFGIGFHKNGTFTAYFNRFAFHSLPRIVSAISWAQLPDGEGSIETSLLLYTIVVTKEGKQPKTFVHIFLSVVLVVFFAMLTSAFVIFLIEERVSQFAHQQSLTGISPFVFWTACMIYDLVFYYLVCYVLIMIFYYFDWMHGHIEMILFLATLYFFACVPFIYSVSFLISSPLKATVVLMLWQVVAAFFGVFILFMSSAVLNDKKYPFMPIVRYAMMLVFPTFSFFASLFDVGDFGKYYSFIELFAWNKLGKKVVCMAVFSVASLTLFLALQFKVVRRALQGIFNGGRKSASFPVNGPALLKDLPICSLVEKERDLVINGNTEDHALVVKNLTKTYGSFKAVNSLCMAVEQNECFGLLGQNGAGKTTTFNILTGQAFPTEGEATIGGRDVAEQIAIGYCPQFDALMNDFTGRETLEILAQMHGFDDYKGKVDVVLKSVGMVENANKLVRYYSGGQKRKISVGIALLAPTHIIILDEPTAGIDPKARRDIWEVLLRVRDNTNSALLLTSHSMDECEALCTRIAVLNKGSLIAIGTSQDLKSLYGNNYTMTLTLRNENCLERIVEKVKNHFHDSVLKNAHNASLTLKWRIKKEAEDKWSEKFKEVEEFAKDPDITDFCLAQTTLEETFLRLSGTTEAGPQEGPPVPRRRRPVGQGVQKPLLKSSESKPSQSGASYFMPTKSKESQSKPGPTTSKSRPSQSPKKT